jgi:hypothetical protein
MALTACAAVAVPMTLVTGEAAAAGLSAGNIWCASLGTHAGYTSMLCTVDVSGGTSPYTQTWSGLTNSGFSGMGVHTGRGNCNRSTNYKVRVTVNDAAGHSVSVDSRAFYCDPIAW